MLQGTQPNKKKIGEDLHQSLMLVTALTPIIGYDKASQMAHYADKHHCTLDEANEHFKFLSTKEFNAAVDPYQMAKGGREK